MGNVLSSKAKKRAATSPAGAKAAVDTGDEAAGVDKRRHTTSAVPQLPPITEVVPLTEVAAPEKESGGGALNAAPEKEKAEGALNATLPSTDGDEIPLESQEVKTVKQADAIFSR